MNYFEYLRKQRDEFYARQFSLLTTNAATPLAPHGGCYREECTICNTPHNPYPTSWKKQEGEEK